MPFGWIQTAFNFGIAKCGEIFMSFVFAHILENLTVCSLISLLNSTNNLAMLNIIGMTTNKLLQKTFHLL